MKRFFKFGFLGAILIVLAAVVIVKINADIERRETRPRPDPPVKLEKPARVTLYHTLQFNGDVSAIQQADIFSKVSGNIERIFTDIGSFVRRNQLLAIIDSTELYQKVQETEAVYYNARINYDRTRQLLEQEILAKEDLDNADATLKIARANYESARTKLGYAYITSPFSGFITKRYLDAGALVSPNNTLLFTVMDLDKVKITVNVLERDIALIPEVRQAVIRVDAFPGKEFTGSISRFSQALDLATRTMAVEIEIPNKDHTLKPGMFAIVTLILAEKPNVLTLPTQAIMKDTRGSFVYIVNSNTVKRVDIVAGIEQDSRTEIVSGLAGDEDIVTTGQQFIRAGGSVRIQE